MDRFGIGTPVRAGRIDEVRVTDADGRVEAADFSGADLETLPVVNGQFGIETVDDRRLRVRYERRADIHEALLTIGCCLVCFKQLQAAGAL